MCSISRFCLIACLYSFLVGCHTAAANDVVVRTAEEVARVRYSGCSYGDDPSKNQVNCVQFLGAVIQALLHRPLTETERDAIYIRTQFPDLALAVKRGDRRTEGVVYALVDVMRIGRQIEPEDASPGDFIQYWFRRNDGSWMGHSAIISKVWHDSRGVPRAEIFGAHRSINRIGFTSFSNGEGLALQGVDRKIYVARFEALEMSKP